MGGSHRLNDLLKVTGLMAEPALNSGPQLPSCVNFSQPLAIWVSAHVYAAPENTTQKETLAAGSGEAGGGRRVGLGPRLGSNRA